MNDVIEELATVSPRTAQVVELRFFADLTLSEIVASLGVSKSTVKSDWRFARAFLMSRLSHDELLPDEA